MVPLKATVTGGYLVLPEAARSALGLQPGDRVLFQLNGDTLELTRADGTAEKRQGEAVPARGARPSTRRAPRAVAAD